MTQITDHLANIERRVALALERANRPDDTVMIVAVSKRHSEESIEGAFEAGLRHFGENYLQEALEKMSALASLPIVWHFIGRLQSNKTRLVAERFDWVQTVDRARIARRLNTHRPDHAAALNVLIQLNLDAEPQKGGVRASELTALAELIDSLPKLKLRGLMSMPPADKPPDENERHFRAVLSHADDLRRRGFDIDTVSMGMSADFEQAIACGSTCVRIGTALFGARGEN